MSNNSLCDGSHDTAFLSQVKMVMQVPYFMQVPRSEVLERVSSILKDNGFCPTRECVDIGNLYSFCTLFPFFNDHGFKI